jgi:hypothetical protein
VIKWLIEKSECPLCRTNFHEDIEEFGLGHPRHQALTRDDPNVLNEILLGLID